MINERTPWPSRQWFNEDPSASATIGARINPKVSLLSSSVTIGAGLFFLNAAGESLVGMPLAELGIVGLLLLAPKAAMRPTSGSRRTGLVILAASLAALAATSDLINGFGPFEMAKDSMRLLLLFAPALLLATSARPKWFLGVALGFMLADSLSAGLAIAIAIVTEGDLRALKFILPMPGILLLIAVTSRGRVSTPLLLALTAGLLFASSAAVLSGSRNAFVSLAIVGGMWAVGRPAPRASYATILLGGAMAWIPIAFVLALPVVDFLYSADIATAGNLERSISMLVGRGLIELSPLTGTGLAVFADALNAEMQSIAGLSAVALDPHNFYMQVGVAFGIPAMILVTITVVAMFRWGFRASSLVWWHRGACLLLLGWIAAITPLSGASRLEWLALWVILLALPTSVESGGRALTRRSSDWSGRPFPTPDPLALHVRPRSTPSSGT